MTDRMKHHSPQSQQEPSDFTMLHWKRHELKVMAVVVLAFVALIAFTAGALVGHP